MKTPPVTPQQLDLGFLQEKNKQRVCTLTSCHESIAYIHTFSACERSSSRSWLSSSPTDSLICDQTRNRKYKIMHFIFTVALSMQKYDLCKIFKSHSLQGRSQGGA